MSTEPRKRGRPERKPDAAIQAHLVELLECATPVKVACGSVGLSPSTFYSWLARGAAGEEGFIEFSDAITRARGRATQTLLRIVWTAAETDWRAAAQLLRLRLPAEEWRDEPPKAQVREIPMSTDAELSALLGTLREERLRNGQPW